MHGNLPVRFLGVPLVSSKLSYNDCVPLLDRINARISCWSTSLLSLAGRVQLIRSVLFAIQAFWSNHFVLPSSIHTRLQSMLTRFLWKGDVNSRGGAKISWDSICSPLSEGGLGFKNSKDWNKAQMLTHLCKVVNKSKSLWPLWVNSTALKRQHFWTLPMPNDCSWIFRNVLKLRPTARQFITFQLGNGLGTSLWFDPWWDSTCLADRNTDSIISQVNIPYNATVNSLISTGTWVLPSIPSRLHHHNPALILWLQQFNYPSFDLAALDCINWDGMPLRKIKTWHIWNSCRTTRPQVIWSDFVWHKFKILRYAHHEWVLCHGRLPTSFRLANFGLNVSKFCHLCVGGVETDSHLFVICPYSSFILSRIAGVLKISFVGLSWVELLSNLGNIQDSDMRHVALLAAQIFAYHLWRERNARHHDRGSTDPGILLKIIMIDLKAKLRPTAWFQRKVNIDMYRWILI